MFTLIQLFILLLIGYVAGQHFEQRHYRRLKEREVQVQNLPALAGDFKIKQENVEVKLFTGSVVIASDYFKDFASGLRSLFGGRLKNYETMIDRGRRESMLRLKEQALQWGAEQIVNIRIETSQVGGIGQNGLPSVEIMTYGTAVRPQNRTHEIQSS